MNQNYLKSILDYNPDTGVFTWKISKRKVKIGNIPGTLRNDGYIQIMIDSKIYLAHRLAWLYVYGAIPINEIDHINHIRTDNILKINDLLNVN